jgi:hypothetical protein
MTIETIVIISGLILVAMLASIVLGGRKSNFESDTTTSYNGRSYQSARTAKENRWG